MRFEHEGRSLWYGTPDAPAPEQVVRPGAEISVTVGVHPVDSSNRVEILYRVNQGAIERAGARWLRTDPSAKAQYFRAALPGFRAGDMVEYVAVCGCAGRQVPAPDEARRLPSSFRIAEAVFKQQITSPRPTPLQDGKEPVHIGDGKGGAALADINLAKPSPIPSRPPGPFTVQGQVLYTNGRAAVRITVRAFDQGLRDEKLLGETTTDDAGGYRITYSHEMSGPDQAKKVALIIRAFDPNGSLLGSSSPLFKVKPGETVDLGIKGKYRGPSEYERIVQDLTPLLQGLTLAELTEDDQRQDITYLAGKSGLDARLVATVAQAHQFSQQSGIRPEFFYALFRAGLAAEEAAFSRTAPETVKTLWEKATGESIIPEELKDQIPQTLERFKAYSAGRLLGSPATVGVSSLNELLNVSLGGDDSRKQLFAQLYTEYGSDPSRFWSSVRTAFGDQATRRLQLDGKLGLLTANNAALIARLHQRASLSAPLDLVRQGFYRSGAWMELLTNDAAVPEAISGSDPQEKKANYADFMANQLRLSYPTAVVAEMVKRDQITLAAEQPVKERVYKFLSDHQGQFELGVQPVAQYLRANKIELDEPVAAELHKLQRVYQISPSGESMATLMAHNVDSAFAAVQYDEREFVQIFKEMPGGEAAARLAYHKAQMVHNTTLNIAVTYLLQKNSSGVYGVALNPAGAGTPSAGAMGAGVTLEGLFGEMDYCACEHCRSWLSPAAYLVDLLLFLDSAPRDSAGKPLAMPSGQTNPLDILLRRRPDIERLQLTCENTNTVLPYIDLVNEILEYYVFNRFSLENFKGYNTEEGAATEELLASPQYVRSEAYTELRQRRFPPPLPFHQPLAALRRYFDHFGAPLHEAMERLRPGDAPAPPAEVDTTGYSRGDILIERLQLSREEYSILTDRRISLQELYGITGAADNTLRDRLANAKYFARLLSLSYEELIEITRTRFINPNSYLIPWLEKLYVSFKTIGDFVNAQTTPITVRAFRAQLPDDLDETPYEGDVAAWVKNNSVEIMGLILLTHPQANDDLCSFDEVELRYSLPDPNQNKLAPVEFRKLLRFIRLWRKLGWTIAQTDKAITALYPSNQWPAPTDSEETVQSMLDAGFKTLIVRLAHLQQVMELLQSKPKRDLLPLLALWAPIDTHGPHSLYRQMFLNPTILRLDGVFQADATGQYLNAEPQEESKLLKAHQEALRAAFNLTAEELSLILENLGFGDDTPLTVPNISAVFRRGYLSRKLGVSVRELLALQALTGLDPFQAPDSTTGPEPALPDTIRFIQMVQLIKRSPFKVSQILYYLRHEDLSVKSSPSHESVLDFARRLRDDLTRIARELAAETDPTDEVARAKMAQVYDDSIARTFFGLINNTTRFTVAYDFKRDDLLEEPDDLLEAINGVTDRITYDDFGKELSFRGVMSTAERDALKDVAGTTAEFDAAVDTLYDKGRTEFRAFFDSVPDLEAWYDEFVVDPAPRETRIAALLQHFLPELQEKLQRQQMRQATSAELGSDLEMVTALLETPALLHAAGQPARSAIAAFIALGKPGVSARIYFADDVTGSPALEEEAVESIYYQPLQMALPQNPAGGDAGISGVWSALLQPPDNGFYNFYVRAGAQAEIILRIDDQTRSLTLENGVWSNDEPVELKAGRLYTLELTAKKAKDLLVLEWASPTMARVPVPPSALYPSIPLQHFTATYVRLLKGLTIAEELGLSAEELKHFGAHHDYQINGAGWLNALPVAPQPAADATTRALLDGFTALLQYDALKQEMKLRDGSLALLLEDPEATTGEGASLLLRVTGWNEDDLDKLIERFGLNRSALSLPHFRRLKDAFEVLKTLGVNAATLVKVTTNNPNGETVRDLQGALRARYDASAWNKVAQPINDALRSQQRDALVACILHEFSLKDDMSLKQIDTPDKLFEYFLIDVEMDPCMQTSRIKQAISTVQLFIQRCLLNLEPQVKASSINAREWEWMKRYRVWEANRKVFLFPENWLEPELRNDKSPFFRDLESELLQSDITDDAAATALLHYLEKLDEVAKLEICGMYYEENEEGNSADDIIHVVARTTGARRTYYYRRLDGCFWTPWEKVDLNIEDNPILPVVWKGRLFLFWVSMLQEGVAQETSGLGSNKLIELSASELRGASGDVKIKVKVTLFWSEHYNGKWQPARTSDINRPVELGQFLPGAFDRANLKLRSVNYGGVLYIQVDYPDVTDGQDHLYFRLYNTHSSPFQRNEALDPPENQDETLDGILYRDPIPTRFFKLENGNLRIDYSLFDGNDDFSHEILLPPEFDEHTVMEPAHWVNRIIETPFFFQGSRHAFFVRPSRRNIPAITQPGAFPTPGMTDDNRPSLPMDKPAGSGTGGMNLGNGLAGPGTGANRLTGPNVTVRFGDRLIGAGGSIAPRGLKESKK
jgi:Neuraminidase-like domain